MSLMGQKYVDTKWDYRAEDTKGLTHCFHAYPAIMIPQVAAELIKRYGEGAKLLFDPYCGSGTSLVEASVRGINSIGTDLNPLARLLSRAKTTVPSISELEEHIHTFRDMVFRVCFNGNGQNEVLVPRFKNIDYWFAADVQLKLALIKDFIDSVHDEQIRDFFKVCFSETIRESSWTRNGEFKLFRMTEKQMASFEPDVLGIMERKIYRAREGLISFARAKRGNAYARVFDFNTVDGVPKEAISPGSVDIVVTSPPYGDSRTTVAYGQYSRLSSQWLGFAEAEKVDSLLMGGRRAVGETHFGCEPLDNALQLIQSKDKNRALDVISFYEDYRRSIANVSQLLRSGGHICYVVGNRRVKGETLPTDEITKSFFEDHGFTHLETIVRNIPNKRMPSKNSPSNVVGDLDTTMTNEFIVIMRKS